MKKAALFLIILFVTCLVTQAQEDIFKKHGVTKTPLTLSKGKYKETFYNEEIMQVGTVLMNTLTNKVVKFLEEDTTKYAYRAEATSRFLTVDPLAEEFYSWSPYVYVMNNPINAVDLRGDSVWFTIDNNVATMHVTGKVINRSSDNINMTRAAKDIASGISNAFGGKFEVNGKSYTMETNVQITAVTSMDDVSASDHLFVLSDIIGSADIPGRAATNEMGGKVISVWSGDFANDNWLSNTFSSNNIRSSVHEFGHALGLSHESASGWRNLMTQSASGGNITPNQRGFIFNNYQQRVLNRGSNSMMLDGVRQPNPTYKYYNTNQRKFEVIHINRIGLKHKY